MKMPEKYKKIILSVLIIDFLLILLHLLFGRNYYFFNLDMERNLPAIYSGTKLIFIGILGFLIYRLNSNKKFWPWLIFGAMFVFIGIDEIFEIHEWAGNYFAKQGLENLGWYSNPVFYWILVFLPLIILAIIFLSYFIKYFLPKKSVKYFFTAGLLFFVGVIVLEISGGFLTNLPEIYQILIIFEESFEIFGATMFLTGTLKYIEEQKI